MQQTIHRQLWNALGPATYYPSRLRSRMRTQPPTNHNPFQCPLALDRNTCEREWMQRRGSLTNNLKSIEAKTQDYRFFFWASFFFRPGLGPAASSSNLPLAYQRHGVLLRWSVTHTIRFRAATAGDPPRNHWNPQRPCHDAQRLGFIVGGGRRICGGGARDCDKVSCLRVWD